MSLETSGRALAPSLFDEVAEDGIGDGVAVEGARSSPELVEDDERPARVQIGHKNISYAPIRHVPALCSALLISSCPCLTISSLFPPPTPSLLLLSHLDVAFWRMLEVCQSHQASRGNFLLPTSLSSTMNVDCPAMMRSLAPILVKILSTGRILQQAAGTYAPIFARRSGGGGRARGGRTCAMMTAMHVCRSSVDFPPMFGPVTTHALWNPSEQAAAPSTTSLGTKV